MKHTIQFRKVSILVAEITFLVAMVIFAPTEIFSQENDSQITVKTWSRENTIVTSRSRLIKLSDEMDEYDYYFVSRSGSKTYKLQFNRVVTRTPLRKAINCWRVSLTKVVKKARVRKNIEGPNLLFTDGPGVGDTFSKENAASYFCELPAPNRPFDDNLYPLETRRTFLIDRFSLSLETLRSHYDSKSGKLNLLELKLLLKNLRKNRVRPA